MLDIRTIYELQTEYKVSEGTFKDTEVSFADYLAQCRTFIRKGLPSNYSKSTLDSEAKEKIQVDLASTFVSKHKANVQGYITPEGVLDSALLLEDIIDSISGVAIIKDALNDPSIDEIQINDMNTLFVIRGGVAEPYIDSKGRVVQFSSDEEISILINKLIDDGTGNIPQFSKGYPLLNAKTAKEQYRLNAVHSSANATDKPPFAFPVTTVTLRKFKDTALTLDQLVETGSMTRDMADFMCLLGRANIKLFCVGATGSGKTTLLNIIAQNIPKDKRIILIQNPTEITFQERDTLGRNLRNVLHWEVVNTQQKGGNTATMPNLISNALRATPDVIIPGEARTPEEFAQMNRVIKVGERIMGTYHAEDAVGALERFADEVSSLGSGSSESVLKGLGKAVDIIIAQHKYEDGSRKIKEIVEIGGLDSKGDVIYNTLYKLEYDGTTKVNEQGKVVIGCKFVRCNPISERLKNKFFESGISASELEVFLRDAGDDNV